MEDDTSGSVFTVEQSLTQSTARGHDIRLIKVTTDSHDTDNIMSSMNNNINNTKPQNGKGRPKISDSWDKDIKEINENAFKKIDNELSQRDAQYSDKFKDFEQRFARLEAKLDEANNASTVNLSTADQSCPTTTPQEPHPDLKQYINQITDKLDGLDKQLRQSNIIIKGFNTTDTPHYKLKDMVDKFLSDNLGVLSCVESAQIIGRSGNVIKAKITTMVYRDTIMRKQKTLGPKRIYIEDDRTPEERKIYHALRIRAKQLRGQGHKVKLDNSQLMVDGVWQDVDIEQLPSPNRSDLENSTSTSLVTGFIIYKTLFNKDLDSECIPKDWAHVALVMLHKKGDKLNPANYRGLAMVNLITKIFTMTIKHRLEHWVTRNNILPEEQAGFTANKSCLHNIFVLQTVIHLKLKNRRGKAYGLFIDFGRAFDSVPHLLLWNKLHDLGISPKIIRLLKNLYAQAILQIKSTDQLSSKFEVTERVLQGEILSPLLFILFLHDIVTFFRDKGAKGFRINNLHDIILLLYADDLVIMADSTADLNKKLIILREYCSQNKLIVNIDKTRVLHFKRAGKGDSTRLYYDKELIEWSNEYEYLGVPFSTSALGLVATNAASRKAKLAMGAVLSTLARIGADSWDGILQIYRSCVLSSLLYAAQLWGLRYLDKLEQIQLCFFKRLLALVPGAPNAELRLELNISIIKLEVLKPSLNWVCKILDMEDHRLPKLCFLRTLQLSRVQPADTKYNWVVQLKNLLQLGQAPCSLWTNLTSAHWKAQIPAIFRNAEFNLKLTDLNSVLDNHSSQIPLWNGPQRASPSYLRNNPLYLSRTFAQLRLANKHYVALSCNRNRVYIDPTVICTICNLNELEDLEHIFLRCPIYQPYRDHF
ncbi:Similar to RTase: Probable RNA-directed DNA polymerase from transposon BS (Drosophila melanogaster) [Cotesia congregata]|uniref:Similar to RTase: Probable RNA-directed DNA polymerase from transposon BS (Drosophila melanogaster) n=1 Tax=Cotesia congregata TaxID=51543 RepID=A0A8J2HLR4_COTCN|nr:Similar to RTase: Probable RNA-directed DNA polymerase from transposon BS (Drosophila melanogaster) [Cotesia congregata]